MIEYRRAKMGDAAGLAEMASRCFSDTFAHLYRPEDLDSFLRTAFGPAGLPGQIDDPGYDIRIAVADGAIVGFAKVGACSLPQPAPPHAVELKQLYVLAAWQGSGVAAALMDWAVSTAGARGADAMVLSVYCDNLRAQRFYARYGFREIGKAPFRVGTQIDDDRIWCRVMHDH